MLNKTWTALDSTIASALLGYLGLYKLEVRVYLLWALLFKANAVRVVAGWLFYLGCLGIKMAVGWGRK